MNDIKLHFAGLWAVVGEPSVENKVRTALHFFGNNYMVFLDFTKPNFLSQIMYHYVLADGELSMQLLDHESKEEQPIIPLRWRLLEKRLLRFEQADRKYSVWEPVTAEQLEREGFPQAALDSLRKAFLDAGSFYSTVPLVPDSSAFRASKKGQSN